MTNTTKNASQVFGIPMAAQAITPIIINAVNNGFLKPLLSAAAPQTGPNSATRIVEIEMA